MCFSRKSQKFVVFLGKIQEINTLEANNRQFSGNFGQIFAFPTTRH